MSSINRLNFLNVDLPEDIKNYVLVGYFDKAIDLINIYKKRNISTMLNERLDFEIVRIKKLENEYTFSFDKALEFAIERVEGFNKEELEQLMDQRYVDWVFINGEKMITRRFLNNCIKVHPTIKHRLFEKQPPDKSGDLRKQVVDEIIKDGEKSYFIHVKASMKVDSSDELKGDTIRVHLPIPKEAQQIKNIKILSTSPEYKYKSNENHPQRTIFFEDKINEYNEYSVEYSYENHIKYSKLDFNKVSKVQPTFYTSEHLPHIKFSPFLVNLAKEIVQDENNQLKKARLIYDYITQNVQYSFMRPYVAIESIAEYCAYNLKGDCGVQALLFITLCRIVGIPARWQSGLYVNPHYIGCHDWAEFYIEPYGWLFADVSFGGGALRNDDKTGWNFYFGNLDPFRMVANDAFHYPLYPEKEYLRSDPYDNQLGEAETDKMDINNFTTSNLEVIDAYEIKA